MLAHGEDGAVSFSDTRNEIVAESLCVVFNSSEVRTIVIPTAHRTERGRYGVGYACLACEDSIAIRQTRYDDATVFT
jgi:hypothetical protein